VLPNSGTGIVHMKNANRIFVMNQPRLVETQFEAVSVREMQCIGNGVSAFLPGPQQSQP
jgi:hypothetical protein